MSIGTKALETLVASVAEYVSNAISKASYDVTVQGIVTAVLPNNRYKIEIKGTAYTVPSAISQTLAVNNTVLVLIAQNNWNTKYITGKVG